MATTKKSGRPNGAKTPKRPVREGGNAKSTAKAQTYAKSALTKVSLPRTLRPILYAAIAAIILILAVGFWYAKVYAQPERVFWKMVDNNLATSGITRETPQAACVPNAESTNLLQISFVPKLSLHCITHINQGSVKLTIETIGNTNADYARYSKVETTAKSSGSDKYSKVYDLWIKNNGNPSGLPNLYGQLLNDPILFGYLTPKQRQDVAAGLKKAYVIDYKNVRKDREGARQNYTYTVSVSLKNFAIAERAYADTLQLPIASRINPDSYPSSAKVDVKFTVDVLSRHLTGITFQSTSEKYSGYGITNPAEIPAKTVSIQELQNAFQSVK